MGGTDHHDELTETANRFADEFDSVLERLTKARITLEAVCAAGQMFNPHDHPLLDEAASPQDWWDRRHREGARGNHRAHGILWGFPAVWLELSFYDPVWRISS